MANALPVRRKGKDAGHRSYPQISLTEARAKQSDAKMKLLAGVNYIRTETGYKEEGKGRSI